MPSDQSEEETVIIESTKACKRKSLDEGNNENEEPRQSKRGRPPNVEAATIDVVCVKLQIEDDKHPFYYANGRTEMYALDDIMGYKEKNIKKEEVIIRILCL